MTPSDPGQGDHEAELTYAWSWFQYSAAQRLTAFNFFLIIVGVIAVAFTHAIDKNWGMVGAAVGALGALIAVGFLALDVRNEELVNCGREALRVLEDGQRLSVHPSREALDRSRLKGTGWIGSWAYKPSRRSWVSHRFWLRFIEGAVAVMFATGAIWAALGFSGVPRAAGSQTVNGTSAHLKPPATHRHGSGRGRAP